MSSLHTIKLSCQFHPVAVLIDDTHAGDVVCPECGLVVGDRIIDVGSEWRTFSNEKDSKDNSRVGAAENTLLSGSDLTTNITIQPGSSQYDENGRLMYNYRRNVSGSDRLLLNAFREIKHMADSLHLPKKIADYANVLFKKVRDSQSIKGRSKDAISSACLYIACRNDGVPRTFKELCAVSKVSKKDIGRAFKLVMKSVETNIKDVIKSSDFMTRFCANLNLYSNIRKAAKQIADKATALNLVSGRSPISVASAAIYMACQASKDKMSAKEIGDVTGVAESTIKQVYKMMVDHAQELFPEDFVFAVPINDLPQ